MISHRGPAIRSVAPLLAAVLLASAGGPPAPTPPPRAVANDNRAPAGRLRRDSLELHLVVELAEWRPEGNDRPAVVVPAVAEEGRSPSVPGPLVRVREGTVIVATIRNALPDSTIAVHGLVTRPAAADDSVTLRPGDSRRVTFVAGAPGTYFYFANIGHRDFVKDDERETASGAFVVDPRAGSPPDRIWVLNIWGHTVDSSSYQNALAINGRSWPLTEPITLDVGDTVRWRVINPTVRPHPMHLHGFFFRVDARGNALVDTVYAADRRMDEVTESMWPFSTYDMTWSPDRPGNWVYHCHIAYHVTDFATLEPPPPTGRDPRAMADDPRVHMAGLVLGITVRPRAGAKAAPPETRHLDLYVDRGARRGAAPDPMGYVV
ncbi:MAG TPA: multicopper oxidase domain-containing protein, partial [Gemmatimonadales bacterium]|nr:multicopper oxidase domain-containing protein [Gemmatimonadales bacterium]